MSEDNKNLNNTETEQESKEDSLTTPVSEKLNLRKLKHGGFSAALTLIFIAAAVLFNVVFDLLISRFNIRFDLSERGLYSIEKSTYEYISALDDTINFYFCSPEEAFTGRGQVYLQVYETARRFAEANKNTNIYFVNRLTDPAFSAKYGGNLTDSDVIIESERTGRYQVVREADYIIFEYFLNGEQITEQMAFEAASFGLHELLHRDVSAGTEQAFLSAVMRVSDTTPVRVAFSNGFGERGYEAMAELLSLNGYLIEEIDLLTTAVIDPDLDFLVVFAPTFDLSTSACEAVNNWLDNSGVYGKSMLYFPSMELLDAPNTDSLLAQWGMWVEPGFIAQSNPGYSFHTDEFGFTQFIRATGEAFAEGIIERSLVATYIKPVWISENVSSLSTTPLLITYDGSWVFPLVEIEEVDDWFPVDEVLCVAAMGRKSRFEGTEHLSSRMIVFGSPAFFVGETLDNEQFTNALLLLNVFGDLSGRSDIAARVMPKSFISANFDITTAQANGIAITFVAVIPLIIIITGLVVFFKRRYR
ncbi:MAG: GldG family protein [Oscillospiraceae bacterium]|nr:GldG family protein [Oscillospiraceae bacterium]